jgi:hypothetical protein
MTDNMQPAKGYYSILQFVPDLERAEGANVGIVLFCPEKRFLDIKLAGGNDAVRRLFGRYAFDLKRIDVMKSSFAERIKYEVKNIYSREDFEKFVHTRANQLILTEPRPMKVFDPRKDLEVLAERLVATRHYAAPQREITPRQLINRLDDEFRKRRIDRVIKRGYELEIPLLQKKETYPFAFKNGKPNAVKTVVFGSDIENVRSRASVLAVEGANLASLDWKLNVVAGFNNADPDERKMVKDILTSFPVEYYEESKLEDFVESVANSAHESDF